MGSEKTVDLSMCVTFWQADSFISLVGLSLRMRTAANVPTLDEKICVLARDSGMNGNFLTVFISAIKFTQLLLPVVSMVGLWTLYIETLSYTVSDRWNRGQADIAGQVVLNVPVFSKQAWSMMYIW